jgi:hypothetical protein
MTAKDKANELIVKVLIKFERITLIEAKKIALIALDEMIDYRNGLYINEGSLAHKYLLEIKQEIEKL